MRSTRRGLALAALVLVAACGAADDETRPTFGTVATRDFGEAPVAPTGPNEAATQAFDDILADIPLGLVGTAELQALIDAGDIRHGWLVSDLLRFISPGAEADVLIDGFSELSGVDVRGDEQIEWSPWNVVTNHLIAWDTPPPPDYQRLKGGLFTIAEPAWAPFFDDPDATIDWRWLSWGGVFIDDRPLGDPNRCGARGCIPALDDPELVPADEGGWYPDDSIVFGVTEGDEAVALPQNIMEVHEMVNMTIGGRRFGIPYCTLCGSVQAFRTDVVPDGVETPVLRTSGLLSRSNKVMYDLLTQSAFDTFTGDAVSGPLLDAAVVLEQTSVTVSTWGEWKAAHPATTIIAEDGGIGRSYPDDPLRGRDDDGPIFPIGDADPRLAVQAPVLGIILDDGGPALAFDIAAVDRAITAGDEVELVGVSIRPDGGGFRAFDGDGEVAVHQAFWFAWSQFHPDTLLWPNDA